MRKLMTEENKIMKHGEIGGAVVINKEGKIIVVYNSHADTWSLPKGHIDEGETPLETTRREIIEETGLIDVDFVEELGTYQRLNYKGDEFKNMHMFLFRTPTSSGAHKPTDPQITETRWLTIAEAMKLLTHKKDAEFLASIKSKIIA